MGAPKIPAAPAVPTPPPLPPAISSSQVQGAAMSQRNIAAASAGLGSTILTGPMGADATTTYPGKTLTGA
jgi:hypothetical protein